MAVQIGDTLLFGRGSHLWVVISEPAKNNGDYVIVNLTTDEFRAGKECVLNVGDHQWIREPSYVSYGDARKVTSKEDAQIQLLISQGQIRQHFPMKSAVLQKIIAQAKTSKAIPTDFVALL